MAGNEQKIARRKFVKLAGATALVAPLAGLTACGGDKKPAAAPSAPAAQAPAPKPAPKPVAAAPAPKPPVEAKPAVAAAPSDMPKVSESDPIAQSLGYKHNAADVDTAVHPKRGTPEAANQYCKNCILFSGGDNEWGPCSIFGGKQVNANGWCATYAPKG